MGRLLALLGAALLAVLASRFLAPQTPSLAIPADGPRLPLPPWVLLPSGGRMVTSGTYPPQPPYGIAAVATYEIDGSADDFVAAYHAQLDAAGYAVRPVSVPNLIIDAPDLQLEADQRDGGRTIYITLRSGFGRRFAQLTFWDIPAPRLP